jgi:hypothetical protein
MHTVCAVMTSEFLEFSEQRGNDLTKPWPQAAFPGLKPGDRWCLCASRWLEAMKAGFAPPVILEATHERTLEIIGLDDLEAFATSIPTEETSPTGTKNKVIPIRAETSTPH